MRKLSGYFALSLLLLLGPGVVKSAQHSSGQLPEARAGVLEKLVVLRGAVEIAFDWGRLQGSHSEAQVLPTESVRFEVGADSFFSIVVFNGLLRAIEPGSMDLTTRDSKTLLGLSLVRFDQLVIEQRPASEPFDLVVRDWRTGVVLFNIEGSLPEYDAAKRRLVITGGRLLISEELANQLGRRVAAGTVGGGISIEARMEPIEVNTMADGAVQSASLPARVGETGDAPSGRTSGPDVIVGDISGIFQFGSEGTQVGLAVGTTSCNNGSISLNWFSLPETDHPVIPQALYRMKGGSTNDERFEQIGHSWAKHAFFAFQDNDCGFGCQAASSGAQLGPGCSDPYGPSLNATQEGLGSRAWINPFTGNFPSTASEHGNHAHSGVTHRVLVEGADLNTTMNAGATYFAEAQYVTPHEFAWCQTHPTQCNMYNNASYRRINVAGTTSFTFTSVGSTVRETPAINAWTGATIRTMEPAPGSDGRAFLAYKVTGPVGGLWHYEYAIFNQNLDRAIQSFSVPLGCGIAVSNLGFHAPLNHPGTTNDGTLGNAGYSNAAWTPNQSASALNWSTETFAQNQNANAIRWGTLYNFRFDSNRPPQAVNATIGFFKTGSPMNVAIQAPAPDTCAPLQLTTAVSRKTHGAAGVFDIDLPLTGEPGVECRDSGGNHTIVVAFNNAVVSGNASVTSGVGSVAGNSTFAGNTMTVNITGVADVQKLTLTLSGVTDNNAQVLPDTPLSVNLLIGDTNRNKTVNTTDIGQTKAQSGATVTAGNFPMDVNVSGSIGASDIGQVKANAGHTLP